ILIARVEVHEALAAVDRLNILALAVIGEGAHDERLARIFRIGMLLVDRLELLRSFGQATSLEVGECLVVENVRWFRALNVGRKIEILLRVATCKEQWNCNSRCRQLREVKRKMDLGCASKTHSQSPSRR